MKFLLRKRIIRYSLVFFFVTGILFSCRREIWDTDIERLLTNWTSKQWISTGIASRTYYWSDPRKFIDKDGTTGLWYLPLSGQIRETTFTDTGIIVKDYKILSIDKDHFAKRLLNDSSAPVVTYYAR